MISRIKTTVVGIALVLGSFALATQLPADARADAPASPPSLPASPPSLPASPMLPAIDHASLAEAHTLALDFDEARKELAAGDPNDLGVLVERGRLALYEADCDGALTILARPDVAKTESGAILGDIARGCARVISATVVDKDDAKQVEIRYQDEVDRALTPLLVDTVAKARDALTKDLGVSWPKPTRIIVVRDLLSLSAMTGLPYEAARTTGTVAVAKWGRVTLLSPRASRHGFAWRDTVAHELTHLAVTRASVDRAPLWLQEGVAKREETRWRDAGPFDDRPSPDAIVLRGMELKLDLALDKLGPSIAMLPSADAAMVAFAEVTSFVRYFAATAAPDALPRLLLALRQRKSPDEALKEASSFDLKEWDAKWRAYLAIVDRTHREPLASSFALGAEPPGFREARDRVRLAELLYGRSHAASALGQLDKVKGLTDDPSIRYARARVLQTLGRAKDAELLVQDPKEVVAPYGPWWAIRGIFARGRGDDALTGPSFAEAVAQDPFDLEAACQTRDPGAAAPGGDVRLLCEATRTLAGLPGGGALEPDLGRD
jgi:hypothetical protein